MSDPLSLDALRERERELELDAVLVRGRIEEVRALILQVERRRPGRPRSVPSVAALQHAAEQVNGPQGVAGGIAETEIEDNMRAINEVRGILKTESAA